MKETIGQAAGQVWHMLAEATEPVNLTDIPKKCKLKTQIAYQAVGWLAREGKISYEQQGTRTLVLLDQVACTC